jgi:hypothetical protein
VQTLLDTSADLENVRAGLLKLTRGLYRPQWRSERHAWQRGETDLTGVRRGHRPNRRNTADDVGRWLLPTAPEGIDRVRGCESAIATDAQWSKIVLSWPDAMHGRKCPPRPRR